MAIGGGAADPVSADLLKFIRQGRSFSGHEPHCVFLNTRTPRFADISAASGLNLDDDGRAVGQVDWDQDGDLDLWIVNRNGPQLRFMRNALPPDNHFLAIRLRGTKCNRDAIGARVEIIPAAGNSPRLIRSLRAGDGYLAQSSKWLHFGLADQTQIQRIVVHWPNGGREEFHDLQVDQRYVIEQGTGRAEVWNASRNDIRLATSDSAPPKPPAEIQVLSVSKLPMPILPYRSFDGSVEQVFEPGSGNVVLLNLWASWCQPCLVELSEFVERQDELRAAGIDVVALSVGGLDTANADSSDLPEVEVLRQLGFPFRAGTADAALVQKLQIVNNHLFDLHLPLPVPTSMLIDGNGRLVALYKGRVPVDRVLRDASLVAVDVADRRPQSVPFAGRWQEPLNDISLIPLLDVFIAEGFLAEADDYVRRLTAARKERLLPALVRLGMAFYAQGNGAKAQEHFAVAVKIDPTFVGVETALGQQREREGRPESAVRLYREALRRSPNSVEALNNLAWLLATHPNDSIRNGAEAVRLARQAVQLTGQKDPAILDTWGAALAEAGDFSNARNAALEALGISKAQGRIELASEIEARIKSFENNQPIRRSLR